MLLLIYQSRQLSDVEVYQSIISIKLSLAVHKHTLIVASLHFYLYKAKCTCFKQYQLSTLLPEQIGDQVSSNFKIDIQQLKKKDDESI